MLNIAESKDRVTVSGTVTDVKDGEEVIVSCGCESCTGIKWIDVAGRVQNGGFTVDFEGVKLAKDGYNVIKAKVTSTDDAGNEATAETSQTYTKDLTAPVVGVSVGNVADDNILTKAEQSQPVHRIRGELSGVKADETVQSVRISVNGKTFDAEVAGSRYSADVPSADLAQDKAVRVTAVVADAAGNTDIAEEVREYGVGTPKPVLALGKIAVDNLINKSEADTDSFVLSGTAENVSDGTAVTLAVGRQQTTATVYGGVFQTTVGKAFFGITDTTVTANGTLTARLGYVGDDGKNAQVTASRGYKVDLANTSITLDKITGDNMIDAGEAAQNTVTVSGSVNNGKEGMPVTISIGGKSFTAEVKADGSFRTDIELPRKTDGKYGISASVEKIDGAGNTVLNDKGAAVTVSASQGFVIDTAPPAGQVVFDPIASDNVINEAESLQNKITVSGKVSGLNDGDDVSAVTVNIRGESYAAKVMGTSFSIDVPAYVMRGAASVSAAAEVKDAGGRSGTTAATVQDYGYQTAAPEIEVAVDSINGGKAVRAAALSETVLIEGSLVSGATVSDGTQKVSVRIGGKDYAAETAGSRWTLAVPATALATAEGRLKLSATVTAEDRYGNTAKHTASREYTVDTVAPKPVIAIESVADDDIIGSAELAAGGNAVIAGKVSGEFKTGDILTITAGGHTQEIALDGSGVFRAEVPVSSLAAVAKTAVTVSLTTTDDAGNTATVQAERAYGVQTDNLKIELDRITGDDFVNVTEAQQNITISGRVSGTDAQAGQTVVLTVNGEQLSAEVQPNLTFGIDVPAAKLLADNGYTVQASVENGKEETAKTARSYGVAPEAAAKIDITAIDGDFTVDVAQADAMVRIGGIIETAGLFAEGMNGERLRQITLDIGGKTYNAGITAERGFFIDVPAAELAAADGLAVKIVKIDADKVVPDLIQTGTNSYKVENSAAYANVEVKNIRFDTPHIVQVSDGVYQVKGGNVLPQTVISGTVGGTAKEGDTVSIEAGGKIHTAKVEADNTFTARIATADLAADDSRSITAVLHTTDRAGNAVTVSDSEAYAVRNVSDGLFASLHSRPAKINSDHTDEGYNFPYFIDKAGNLGGGSFGIKLGGFSDEPKVVKYHFMTLDEIRAEKMSDGYVNLDTLTTYSSYLQDLVRSAYQEISAVTNIVFEEVGSVAEANTNYMMGNLINGFQGSAAIAYNSGKVVWNSGQNYMAWGDGFLRYTVLHEIIHTLGMRHSDKAQGGSYDGDYAKESNVEFTLMSYNAYTNNSLFLDLGKLRTYDLAYLQYAHGISKNVRTGNDTYTFKNYNVYSQDADRYIWDAGGTDTFDASHEKQGVHVDLTPGSWIYTGGKREKTFGLEGTSTTDLRKYFGLSDDAKLALGWRVNNSVTLNDYTEGQAFIGFGTQIENLAGSAYGDTLSGNNADNSISGNAGDDLISGGTGNDWLDGGSGADTLAGGSGNDSYIVDDAADTVTEAAQEGEDSVYSHVSHTLGAHLEHLTLLGSTVVSGTGNGGANTLTGNGTANILDGAAGDDRIIGGKGSDTLTGGAGRDTFVFDSVLDGSADTVTDFTAGEDIIELAGSIFQSLTVNVMAEWEHYVQYHADTGFLTYDSDGQGQADAVHFATLDKDLAIDRTSFNVV
ncbi:Ig-like domain-containing protein [Neisseria sp.]|uniref:Ig-like domain-containing protein n=1 Tax=Neisseria sp. TaxID=192066 RepID=UPI0035A04FA1